MKRICVVALLISILLGVCDTFQYALQNTRRPLVTTDNAINVNTISGSDIAFESRTRGPYITRGYQVDGRCRNSLHSTTMLNVVSSMPKSAFTMDFDVEEDDDDDFDDYAHDEVTYRVRSGDVQHIPQAERYSTKDWIHNLRTLPTSRLLQRIKQVVLYNFIWSTLVYIVYTIFKKNFQCPGGRAHSLLGSALEVSGKLLEGSLSSSALV